MAQSFDLFGIKKQKTQIKELQQQIRELRAENQKLGTKLDRRAEKTKMAIARKQDVEERLNRDQQKITTLENELATLKEEASKNIAFSGTYLLNKKSFENIVVELGSIRSESKTFHSVYLNANADVSDFEFGDYIDETCVYLFDQIKSHNGKALFYDENHVIALVIVPPFQIKRSEWTTDDALNLAPLNEMLSCESVICAVQAHAGHTTIGIVEGREVAHAEIVRTGVQAKHTKGGWSQRRFERGRDEDIEHHVKKVQEKLRSIIDDRIEIAIAGGDLNLAKKMLADVTVQLIEKRVDVNGNAEDIAFKLVWAGRLYRL